MLFFPGQKWVPSFGSVSVPSPLAAGLLYQFISTYMYEWDTPKAEQQLHSLALRRELVEDLLEGSDSRRLPLRPEAVENVIADAGHTAGHLGSGCGAQHDAGGLSDLHTLGDMKAVKAAGTDDADAVMAQLKKAKINDMFTKNGVIRADGRMVHDMYLMQVKSPAESKEPWDYFKLAQTIPGDEAYTKLANSKCPLVKK